MAVTRKDFLKKSTLGFLGLWGAKYPIFSAQLQQASITDSYYPNVNNFTDKYDGERLILHVDEIILDGDFKPSKPVVIYASTVTIKGELKFNSPSLTIFTMNLISKKGSIDLSGDDGVNIFPTTAAGGCQFGAGHDGIDGLNGTFGKNGGNIILYCGNIIGNLQLISNGGKGASGQNGSDGCEGNTGAEGAPGANKCNNDNDGKPGGQGGTGGANGIGGVGGRGGKNGEILVYCLKNEFEDWRGTVIEGNTLYTETNSRVKIEAISKVGDNGDCGLDGLPGAGGPPGIGGRNFSCNYEREEPPFHKDGPSDTDYPDCICRENGRSSQNNGFGAVGQIRTSNTCDSKTDLISQNPVIFVFEQASVLAKLYDVASIYYGHLLLNKIRQYYLNNEKQETEALLNWANIVIGNNNKNTDRFFDKNKNSEDYGNPYPQEFSVTTLDWVHIKNKLNVYNLNYSMGFDYFGNIANYTPLLSYEYFENLYNELVLYAREIENGYNQYINNFNSNVKEITETAIDIEHLQKLIIQKSDELQNTQKICNEIDAKIANYTDWIIKFKNELILSNDDFRLAVEKELRRQGGGCDIVQSIAVISSFVTFGVTTFSSVKSILETSKNLYKNGQNISNALVNVKEIKGLGDINFDAIPNGIQKITSDMNTIKNYYNKYKSEIESNTPKQLAFIDENNYLEILKPYLSLPETQILKNEIENFLGVIKERNTALVDYTEMVSKIAMLSSEVNYLTAQVNDLKSFNTASKIDYLNSLKGKMLYDNLYDSAKEFMIRLVYLNQKALQYWSLQLEIPKINTFNIDSISQYYTDLKQLKLTYLLKNPGGFNSFGDSSPIIKKIKFSEYPILKNEIINNKSVIINIDKDDSFLPPFAQLLCYDIRVIPVINANTDLIFMRLTNSGTGTLVNKANQALDFNYSTNFQVPLAYDLKNKKSLGNFGNIIGIKDANAIQNAPLPVISSWKLEFINKSSDSIDYNSITDLEIEFRINFK